MGRLTESDRTEFLAIKGLCYQGLDSTSLRERAGERLSRHVRATSYCFGASDPSTALPIHSLTVGLEPESIASFFRLLLMTPALDFGRWSSRPHRAARLEELVEAIDEDPYMLEILRPSGLRYEVQMACVGAGRPWGHLCLRRKGDEGPFEAHTLRFLAALAPHLAAGLRSAARRAALAAVPGDQSGVVVLGPDGDVELANGVAERLFTRPTRGTRHSFLTAVHIVAARLERALSGEGADEIPALMVVDEENGAAYRLRAECVTGADGRNRGLVLIEPAVAMADTLDALTQMGLTPREAEVAQAVLRGQTTVAIAAELVVSPHTVHDHLRKVFDKLGVSSRQQMAVRLLGAA